MEKCISCIYYGEVNHEDSRKCKCYCDYDLYTTGERKEIDEDNNSCEKFEDVYFATKEITGEKEDELVSVDHAIFSSIFKTIRDHNRETN